MPRPTDDMPTHSAPGTASRRERPPLADPRPHGAALVNPSSPEPSTGTVAVVLAAGLGTRMRSRCPKVLHPLCGRPMLAYVLDAWPAPADGQPARRRRRLLAGRRGHP